MNKLKFKKELISSTFDKSDIDDNEYKYEYNKNMCNFCGLVDIDTYITYIETLKIKTHACYLCNLTINFSKNSLGKCFIIHTHIDQAVINKMLYEKYINNKNILPTDIDEDCSIVHINPYIFININKELKMNDFRIFFTKDILEKTFYKKQNIFKKGIKYEYDKSEYNDIPEYIFSKKDMKLINTEIDKQHIKQLNILNKIKNNMNNKTI